MHWTSNASGATDRLPNKRTVVLGGGEAGLIAAAYLERTSETDTVVVSERERHVFSFLLYRVMEGCRSTGRRSTYGTRLPTETSPSSGITSRGCRN